MDNVVVSPSNVMTVPHVESAVSAGRFALFVL